MVGRSFVWADAAIANFDANGSIAKKTRRKPGRGKKKIDGNIVDTASTARSGVCEPKRPVHSECG